MVYHGVVGGLMLVFGLVLAFFVFVKKWSVWRAFWPSVLCSIVVLGVVALGGISSLLSTLGSLEYNHGATLPHARLVPYTLPTFPSLDSEDMRDIYLMVGRTTVSVIECLGLWLMLVGGKTVYGWVKRPKETPPRI